MIPFITQCNFDGPPLELMGPGVIVPPAPPLVGPDKRLILARNQIMF